MIQGVRYPTLAFITGGAGQFAFSHGIYLLMLELEIHVGGTTINRQPEHPVWISSRLIRLCIYYDFSR